MEPKENQSELFPGATETDGGVRVKRYARRKAVRQLQDVLWPDSIRAVQIAAACGSFEEFVARLPGDLSQGSEHTRGRAVSTILSRYFADLTVDTLPCRVWRTWNDPALLEAVMGPLLLQSEPLLGRLVAERLHPIPPGSMLPLDFFRHYGDEVGGRNAINVSKRCAGAARNLGWIARVRGRSVRVQPRIDPTAALLLLQREYAPTPRIVDLEAVAAGTLWKYLGFSSVQELRACIASFVERGLIARFVQVDRLDQFTTRYTLDELLERGLRA